MAIDSGGVQHHPPPGPRVGDGVQQSGGAPDPRQVPGEHPAQLGPVLVDRPQRNSATDRPTAAASQDYADFPRGRDQDQPGPCA
ncbi:MAG TPA: hypothetical protein VIJ23_18150, partial [Mycobacterium sp.]